MDGQVFLLIGIGAICVVLVFWMIQSFISSTIDQKFAALSANLTRQNVTVTLTRNDTDKLNETGKISGLAGSPVEILNASDN